MQIGNCTKGRLCVGKRVKAYPGARALHRRHDVILGVPNDPTRTVGPGSVLVPLEGGETRYFDRGNGGFDTPPTPLTRTRRPANPAWSTPLDLVAFLEGTGSFIAK